ncbi:MAG TPA: DNA methyltransferase [Planctomycetota bacterium]|nr:DNA methyltransferase [Planctomycetota bacterium]
MSRRRGGPNVRAYQRERVAAREELERRFGARLEADPTFERLVTAETSREEPFHRWHPYRQAFAPGLVRRFLEEAAPVDGPILDPFSGSGTTVVECARQGRSAIGVEAVPVLGRLTLARFVARAPALPEVAAGSSLQTWFSASDDPAHRAAVLLAAGRTVSGAGRPKQAASPEELVRDVYALMVEDLQAPLPPLGGVVCGDARRLPVADSVLGGLVTSPPYLSRYDYARINAPMERLLRTSERKDLMKRQLRAAVGVRDPNLRRRSKAPLPAAAEEAARGLEERGNRADAAVVRNYFIDLRLMLREAQRTLRPGAPCWVVIGGADLDREYIASDFILAEDAEAMGFELEAVTEARRLRWSTRRLGLLDDVAPRESVVRLRKRIGPAAVDGEA